jgi:hypothetical protein
MEKKTYVHTAKKNNKIIANITESVVRIELTIYLHITTSVVIKIRIITRRAVGPRTFCNHTGYFLHVLQTTTFMNNFSQKHRCFSYRGNSSFTYPVVVEVCELSKSRSGKSVGGKSKLELFKSNRADIAGTATQELIRSTCDNRSSRTRSSRWACSYYCIQTVLSSGKY